MLKSLDDSVGRVIQSLKDEGMLENSVLIFIADNGGVPVDDLNSHGNAGSNWPLRGVKLFKFFYFEKVRREGESERERERRRESD